MSMQIVFEQILIIFGYVIVGYVAGLQCCQQAAWRQVDKI